MKKRIDENAILQRLSNGNLALIRGGSGNGGGDILNPLSKACTIPQENCTPPIQNCTPLDMSSGDDWSIQIGCSVTLNGKCSK